MSVLSSTGPTSGASVYLMDKLLKKEAEKQMSYIITANITKRYDRILYF